MLHSKDGAGQLLEGLTWDVKPLDNEQSKIIELMITVQGSNYRVHGTCRYDLQAQISFNYIRQGDGPSREESFV